jgi:predicted HTH domain antitoxin
MSALVNLEVPQDIVDAARLTPHELKVELAISLYAQNRLSVGLSRQLAGLSLWEFRQLLATRHIPPHYTASDLEDDLDTLEKFNQQS